MRLLLLKAGLDIKVKADEKYIFVIAIAEGKLKYSDICSWIKKYLK